jgi:hypothetical protein
MWTGGTRVQLGGIRLSSRGPRNPALITLIGFLLAWALAPSGQRLRTLATEYSRLLDIVARRVPRLPAMPRAAHVVTALAAVCVVIAGVTEGAFVAGGSDSYGYVSQAHLWEAGELRQEPALVRQMPADLPLDVLSPLGYRPTIDGTTIAPTYPPGLPMVMAIFEKLAGPRSVFWVVSILGGVLVWATYVLGSRVYRPAVGASAAVLAATSAPVLVQLTSAPMSDLPAAAWWAVAFALISLDRRSSAFGAGIAAGVAILTRPNLAPLVAVAGVCLLWRLMAARRPLSLVIQHAVLFAGAPIAACLAFGAINRLLWGSALTSGHGPLSLLFSLANVWPNLLLYPRVIATQMPAVLLIPIAAIERRGYGVRRRYDDGDRSMTIALWAWIAAVFLAYVAYPAYDSEVNLRFLLPAVPALVVLASAAALSLAGPVIDTHRAACVVLSLVVTGYGVHSARIRGAFETDHLEKFATAGNLIEQRLPERAVLLAMLHSGSANYYSGRSIIRYDLLPPTRLDGLIEELQQRGYEPYILLDPDEREVFQSRYRGHSRLAALDWPPVVTLMPSGVQIFGLPSTTRP